MDTTLAGIVKDMASLAKRLNVLIGEPTETNQKPLSPRGNGSIGVKRGKGTGGHRFITQPGQDEFELDAPKTANRVPNVLKGSVEDDGELVYADRTLLTVNQVASATGYNKQTISRFCIAGRIRATREMLVNRIGSRYPA